MVNGKTHHFNLVSWHILFYFFYKYTNLVWAICLCGRNESFPNQVLFALGIGREADAILKNLFNPTSGRDASHPCLISTWPKEGCTIVCVASAHRPIPKRTIPDWGKICSFHSLYFCFFFFNIYIYLRILIYVSVCVFWFRSCYYDTKIFTIVEILILYIYIQKEWMRKATVVSLQYFWFV